MLKLYGTSGSLRKSLINLRQFQPQIQRLGKPFALVQHQPSFSHHHDTTKSSAVIDIPRLATPKHTKHSYSTSDTHGLRLLSDTIADRIDALALTSPHETAYRFCLTQQSITFADLKQRTDAIAQNLLHMGFSKGDRLAVLLPNIPELNLTLMACATIGV